MDSQILTQLFGLEDQVVVVTGGGGILCGMAARGLAKVGAKVVVLDLSLPNAQTVVEEIEREGGEAMALCADCVERNSLELACEQILARYGRIDVLINGAGGNRKDATTTPDQRFFDISETAFKEVLNLNFVSAVLPSQVFGRHMAERGDGVILNIASINAVRPLTNIPAYSAGKAAVLNFTQWLAVHMSQNYSPRIRVNAIAPGFYLTEQNRFLLQDQETGGLTARGQTVVSHTPMNRFGDPQELLSTIIWLLSPGASFVHGSLVVVDGGFAAFSGV